jgi:hypothetical protein
VGMGRPRIKLVMDIAASPRRNGQELNEKLLQREWESRDA